MPQGVTGAFEDALHMPQGPFSHGTQARRISDVTHEKPLPEGIFKRVQMQAGDTAWPLSL